MPLVALDYLSVGTAHGGSSTEHGHAVLGIVVQDFRTQHVLLLVPKLHESAPELRKVVIHKIIQLVAGQLRVTLQETDMPHTVDYVGVLAPYGTVGDEVGAVVQKSRVNRPPHEIIPFLGLLYIACADKPQQRISLLGLPLGKQRDGGEEQRYNSCCQSSFLNFCSHPLREKSQSENIGSMTMYVLAILSSMNFPMASIWRRFLTCARSSV